MSVSKQQMERPKSASVFSWLPFVNQTCPQKRITPPKSPTQGLFHQSALKGAIVRFSGSELVKTKERDSSSGSALTRLMAKVWCFA